ncbi:MAG: elongation factor P [Proteobacteria bacterium]|nr:elongation factor P [Pseudomonadota bacterium]
MSKTNANSIRVGNVIEYQNQLWKVLKRDHVKPGKGGAYIQVEMKNIMTGNKTNTRYNSSEDVDVAYVEQKNYQFQYFDQNDLVAMDMESFESFNLSKDLVGEALPFLQEGMDIRVEYCNDKPISIVLPEQVSGIIAQADAVVKGQTAASSYKPAILENGVRVMVPPFVESGEEIIVRTEDFTYVGRAKNTSM